MQKKNAYNVRTAAKKAAIRKVYGRGAYGTKSKSSTKKESKKSSSGGWLSPALGAVGSALGTAIAPGAGTAVGGALGSTVGNLIKSITGFGDYSVMENSLIPEAGTPPVVDNGKLGKATIFKHREYICDITSASTANTFQLQNFFINPGQPSTFPWLSGLAANFEHYQLLGILFEFKSMSADALNSTNTALGQVIMACNYNAALPNFASKYEMENYEYAISTKPACSAMLPIECKRSESVLDGLYVRPGSVPSGQDQRLYDFGNFQIATNGLQGTNVNLGELWVTYEIAFYKPKLYTALGNQVPFAHVYVPGSISNTSPLGNGSPYPALPTSKSTLAVQVYSTQVLFPANIFSGTYYCVFHWHGSSTANTQPPIPTINNGTYVKIWDGGANQYIASTLNATSTDVFICFVFTVTPGQTPSISMGTAGVLPTSSDLDITISQVPLNIN